jgi:lipopolysaccharide transport system ATP-binding protein
MEASITLHKLSKIYPTGGVNPSQEFFSRTASAPAAGGKVAVDEVSLTIQQGERLGIVGSNGAGKSTLLHMIAGLSSQTSGSIEINGKVTSLMTLGVGLRNDLSGRENIYIDGEIQGRTRSDIKRVIDQVIDFADLGEFIDFPVRTYSTGMMARLGFSMISYIDPEILIIDETLTVGDASFSGKATARIKEICAQGKIVIIVSHGMQSIKDICNRCLWMENGRVIMDGSPEEVTTAYIDSVRAADEALLMERFQKLIGARSSQTGWDIKQVTIFNGKTDEQRTLLEAGQPTRVQICAVAPVGQSNYGVHVRITRLDGVLFFDELFHSDMYRLSDQTLGIEIEMTPLLLGVATYKLEVSLEMGSTVFADNASIFEVYSSDLPTGGKPMLLYPITASASDITAIKEVR